MGQFDQWTFFAKPEKPKPQVKQKPQTGNKPDPEPAPPITDYASI